MRLTGLVDHQDLLFAFKQMGEKSYDKLGECQSGLCAFLQIFLNDMMEVILNDIFFAAKVTIVCRTVHTGFGNDLLDGNGCILLLFHQGKQAIGDV